MEMKRVVVARKEIIIIIIIMFIVQNGLQPTVPFNITIFDIKT